MFELRRLVCVALVWGCGGAGHSDRLVLPEGSRQVGGLGSCGDAKDVVLDERPIVVLVHGNHAARNRFVPLAGVLEELGMQTLCFRWIQPGRLTRAASALSQAIKALEDRGPIVVIGHSLGGLAARQALTVERLPSLSAPVDLVTVATPFAGVRAASTCGLVWARVLSLGTVSTICRRITRGSKWRDIHPRSNLIRSPGTLGDYVRTHLHVVTEERGSCRRRDEEGSCAKSDFVFSRAEQNPSAIRVEQLRQTVVRSGHSEVVGGPEGSASFIEALREAGLVRSGPDQDEHSVSTP